MARLAAPAPEPALSAALAIFVKTPGWSAVKTRLAASIGTAAAERFHTLSAKATACVATAAPSAMTACWAVAETEALQQPPWQGLPNLCQGHGNLGTRLHHICSELQTRHDRVLLIGSDAPQITVKLLHAALRALDDPATPFVLGPARDGGFWLFGTRTLIPAESWQQVRYSTPSAAADLTAALAPWGAIARLPTLTDVDTADDLPLLAAALVALTDPLPAQQALLQWLGTPSVAFSKKALRA